MKAICSLAVLAVAGPLAAQQPDSAMQRMHRMGPPPGMMGHVRGMGMMEPMMRGMAFNPGHLLERKDALQLTPQQVTRLTALRDGLKTAHDAGQTEVRTHMDALTTAMKAATPDTNQMKQHFQAAQQAMGRTHWAALSAAAQARGALTEAQRGRVEGWVDAMHMHRQRMREGHERRHPERTDPQKDAAVH